jgi:signal transduction histidine kinase
MRIDLKLISLIFATSLLNVAFIYAQGDDVMVQDSTKFTREELISQRVDTLVKHVRKQFYKNNFGQTIEVGEETLKLARQIDDHNAIFRVSSLMGNAFLQLDDTLQAKRIFFRTIQEAEKLNDTTKSLTTARIDLGNLYALQDKNIQAIALYKKAIPLAVKLKDTTHLFILNYNLAELNLDMERVAAAEEFVANTNKYVSNVKAEAYHAVAQLVTGRLYHLKKEPGKAVPHLRESIRLAEKSGYTEALIEAYEVFAQVQIELENFESSTDLLLKADNLKNEKYKQDKIRAIEMVTAKFKLNQFEQDLKAQTLQNKINQQEAKRETTILWVKIASGILLLCTVFLLRANINRRKLLKNLTKKNIQYLEAKKLSEAQVEAKNLFFSNITHELRTPMYGIIGISSLMLGDKSLRHQSENLKSLKFSANYLLSLINNVLQFTQMNSSTEKIKRSEFNLRDLITNVVESTKYLNTTEPNSYHIHIDENIPKILVGDDIKVSQILMNLVSNASKFTNDGFITIEVEREADNGDQISLHFSIEDTGIGISKERQKLIFTEFGQTCSNYAHQGAGLGLTIVKKLLDLLRSSITLESEPGKGTYISFLLCFDKITEGLHPAPAEFNTDTSIVGKNILVVDDNKINLLVTKKILESYGARVIVANGGKEGIELAQIEIPDLILMDINMPEMNGFEVAEIIRSFVKDVPILALTAVEKEKVILNNNSSLFDDFIIKPYKNEDFISLISNYVGVEVF